MVFPKSLRDSKSPQVSRTLLSILADLNIAAVYMVSTRLLISKSFNPCTNLMVTEPKVPITIEITITFMFHGFFQFSSKVKVLISLFAFFQFNPVVKWNGKIYNPVSFLFSLFLVFFFFFFLLLTISWSGRLAEIRWSVGISKLKEVCASHFPGRILGCAYILFVRMVKFLQNSQWIIFLIQSSYYYYHHLHWSFSHQR